MSDRGLSSASADGAVDQT